MAFWAKQYQPLYEKTMKEQMSRLGPRACPLVRVSAALARELLRLLDAGNPRARHRCCVGVFFC